MRHSTLAAALLALGAQLGAGTATPAVAAERPLAALPYTPSLDVASMDRSADPCVDFYQYSCGGWMKTNPIPADQASWSVYGKLADDNQQFLWGMLEEAGRPTAGRTAVRAEDRRLLRRLHGRGRHREGRAPRRSRPSSTRSRGSSRRASWPPTWAGCTSTVFGSGLALRLRLRPGLRGLHAGDRLRRRRRAGPARPRLLPQDRREVGGDPRQVRGARAAHARARGRPAGGGGRGRAAP